MTLVQALQRTCALLESADDSAWSSESASEIRAQVVQVIDAIQAGAYYDKSNLRFLFLPTGPVQDTAIDNGWGKEMLELAAVVDEYA